ncbi:MAG: hypothetical protein NDJ89_09590 [Oligoflexia bacterium]|nr:hypothetical protein [Oligoflexia bacterium]
MRQWSALKIVVVTSLAWTMCLSSCAGVRVKWWFLDGKERGELIRRDRAGNITESLTFVQADGYFCLTPEDSRLLLDMVKSCKN